MKPSTTKGSDMNSTTSRGRAPRTMTLTRASDIQIAPAPWPYFASCPGCDERVWTGDPVGYRRIHGHDLAPLPHHCPVDGLTYEFAPAPSTLSFQCPACKTGFASLKALESHAARPATTRQHRLHSDFILQSAVKITAVQS
jgi:hypothetical protein